MLTHPTIDHSHAPSDIKSISSLLVANRGEIASRIFRTCRKMGIRSIAVYTDADRHMPYIKDADEAIYIGDSNPKASYLNIDSIIEAAHLSHADAIHPGYGFLSENAAFALRCINENILWIGPHPAAISAMGSKSNAKKLMADHGVPVVPGYQGDVQHIDALITEALNIGFPLLLKATAGGGGKGMRIVREAAELQAAILAAKSESLSAFGDDQLIIEKYISAGRHIEFQIFGDQHGHLIHLLERECTIQRRYQKIIEESPSPIMTEELRYLMGSAAVNAAKALNYDNAGTVEFIYDDISGDFYFLEVNTRLQVEHPVTEEITGLDLVQLQIQSAQGYPLSIVQQDIRGSGYAVEVRLYAEKPHQDFMPATGTIARFITPAVQGLRMESAVVSGSEVSMYYDPMIAKIILKDTSRALAHRKMSYVLSHLVCSGIQTNQEFLQSIFAHPSFAQGQYNTDFISRHIADLLPPKNDKTNLDIACMATTIALWHQRNKNRVLLKSMPSGWRNSYYTDQKSYFLINETPHVVAYRYNNGRFHFGKSVVRLIDIIQDDYTLEIDGRILKFLITLDGKKAIIHHPTVGHITLELHNPLEARAIAKTKGAYESPMPAQIVKLLVTKGSHVISGQELIIISSMKMESTISAYEEGIIEEVLVSEGSNVEAGTILLKIKNDN